MEYWNTRDTTTRQTWVGGLLHNDASSGGSVAARYYGSRQSSGTPWAPGETSWDGWSTNAWQLEIKKLRDGDVPEWDGKTHRTVYFRKIDLWAASTGAPPELRATRSLQKLTGQAFDKLEHVDPDTLKGKDGIAKYKIPIEDA